MTKPLAIAIVAAILAALLAIAAHAVMPGLLGVIATSGPAPDLVVTGTLVPDATGDYFEVGTHLGKSIYKRIDSAYFIWWDGLQWWISPSIDDLDDSWIKEAGEDPTGDYFIYNATAGPATVSAP